MFFASVASKELRYCASSLFATDRRGLRSVASKGLRLHKNCAILGALGERNGGCDAATEAARDVSER
jgi:hypothetical protein